MIKFIVGAWVSPSRKEVYDWNFIDCESHLHGADVDLEMFMSEFCQGGLFDLVFDQDEQDGLWRVVLELDLAYHRDYYGEVDVDYCIERIITKKKTRNISELFSIWCDLKNKVRFSHKNDDFGFFLMGGRN